jgi:hypothetical protein
MMPISQISPLSLSSHGKPVNYFHQTAELEAELKRVVRGEVRLMPAVGRSILRTLQTTARFRSGWSFQGTKTMSPLR